MLVIRTLFILLALSMPFESFSQQVERIVVTPQTHKIEYFSQNDREYSIDYVAKLGAEQWKTVDDTLSFGFISRSYWMKLTIDMPQSVNGRWYLEVSNPLVEKLEVYVETDEGFHSFQAGDTVTAQPNATPTRVYLYPLASDRETNTLYLQYTGNAASSMPLALVSANEALANAASDAFSYGILFLLFLASAFCGVFAFFITTNKTPLYLAGYATASFFMACIIDGYARLVLWPNQPWLQDLITPSLMVLCVWLLALFFKEFFDVKNRLTEGYTQFFSAFTKLQIVSCGVLLVLPIFISAIVSTAIVSLTIAVLIGFSFKLYKAGLAICQLFLIAGISFITVIATKMLYLYGIGPQTELASITRIFYFVHLSFLAAALVKQYYIRNQAQAHEQQNTIDELQAQATQEQENFAEQHEEQLTLEALVDERTFELNVTLRELQETNRRLEEQATNDALTGAKNRKFFDQRLLAEYRLSRRQQTPLSLLMLDIDFFKNVNDTYGHLMGDKVLLSFANKAIGLLRRPNDYVCRYGGEEFAVLLSNTDHKGALKVAELIRQKTENSPVLCDGVQINVTVSIGVATLTVDDSTATDELFSEADKALYQAKELGRNQVYGALQVQA